MEDNGFLDYYNKYSSLVPIKLLIKSLGCQNQIQKYQIINRQKDYINLQNNSNLLSLHRELNEILSEQKRKWNFYDYGEGYFYQSMNSVGITGLRDTEARIKIMGLREYIKEKRLLEIGCSSGFLSLSISDYCQKIDAFDINPYMIKIAIKTMKYLNKKNTEFFINEFENYPIKSNYEVILSFANHSTYDGNTKQSIVEYFRKCSNFLTDDGMLLFESHAPEYEKEGIFEVIKIIESFFSVLTIKVLNYGTFLDNGRTFIVAKKR